MIVHEDGLELRSTVATACRVLAARGLVDGVLGHVSARVADAELVVRCRGDEERGLGLSDPEEVWRFTLDGEPVDAPAGFSPPNELSLHTELLRARPEVGAVVHAHPPAALLVGLAGLEPRPVFGAYNIPAMRLALEGVPVYERSVLITRRELAMEMVEAMGGGHACLLRAHPREVSAEDLAELPDLGSEFNDRLAWQAMVAGLESRSASLS